eukprot:Gb_40226 [translate_table: standard]
MFRVTNGIIGTINFVTFLLSIPIFGGGIWLATRNSSDCLKFLQWPIIIIGAVVMLISLAGFVGACYRISFLLWLYLFVMFLVILVFLGFTIFAFVVTSTGDGHQVLGRVYKEYRLGDYSEWLRKRVGSAGSWNKIRSCVRHAGVCKRLGQSSLNEGAMGFYQRDLNPIQSGCCKPPTSCGFNYINATYWTSSMSSGTDPDCSIWNNDQDRLCYDCSSCKAGVLANLKHDWRRVALLNVVILVLLAVLYIIAYHAFKNNRKLDNDEAYGVNRMTKSHPTTFGDGGF